MHAYGASISIIRFESYLSHTAHRVIESISREVRTYIYGNGLQSWGKWLTFQIYQPPKWPVLLEEYTTRKVNINMAAHRPKIALTHFHSGSNIRQVSQRLLLPDARHCACHALYTVEQSSSLLDIISAETRLHVNSVRRDVGL